MTATFRCAAVVTDIEGTTGSIAFVRDELFPYAKEHLAEFIARHRENAEVVGALRDAAMLAGEPDASEDRIVAILQTWMDEDRKATPLKTLQGFIWADGYANGSLRGHIYDDAVAGLRRWHAGGLALYVYSSGSVAAQKLLFRHSGVGDLTPLFSGYFDTTSGAKTDADSYRRIAAAIGLPPAELLFLSDRVAEVSAANGAGWQVALVVRPADANGEPAAGYKRVASFDEIVIEPTLVSVAPTPRGEVRR